MFFDPLYFLFIAPAFLLAMWAQMRVRSTYASASRQPARLSGAAAARHILDSAGLQSVAIEPIGGQLSDHYDPRTKVLRLSQDIYSGRSLQQRLASPPTKRGTRFKMRGTMPRWSCGT